MSRIQSVNYPMPNGTNADARLTVSNSAVLLTSVLTIADNTTHIVWDVQDNDVMVTFDGSTPSATNGHKLYVGEKDTWHKETARAAKFFRAGSADGTIHASQFAY